MESRLPRLLNASRPHTDTAVPVRPMRALSPPIRDVPRRRDEHPTDPVAVHPHHPIRYAACITGRDVAEILDPHDRRMLIRELHAAGLTDVEIADLTRWTLYVVGRLRDELHLTPTLTHVESKVA